VRRVAEVLSAEFVSSKRALDERAAESLSNLRATVVKRRAPRGSARIRRETYVGAPCFDARCALGDRRSGGDAIKRIRTDEESVTSARSRWARRARSSKRATRLAVGSQRVSWLGTIAMYQRGTTRYSAKTSVCS